MGRVAEFRPQNALRSLLVMYLAGFTSINKWVKELKDTPRYAYLSGFEPERTPSKTYFSWFTSNLLGRNVNIDNVISQGTLLKKIFEIAFVNKSSELGIVDPHDKVIFDSCKVKSFCKQKFIPDKSCRCSCNSIKPFKCSMITDSEATKGYDHNNDNFLMGYGLHFAVTPLLNNPSKCLPLTFFVAGAHVHDSKMVVNFFDVPLSLIGDTVLNNGLKSPLFRGTKNFFVRTALVCMIQHAKAIAEHLASIDYKKITA